MHEVADAILSDLRAASAWLLEAGNTQRLGGDARGPLLSKIHVFTALVPSCLVEIGESARDANPTWIRCRTPKRARPSRSPGDFYAVGEHCFPLRWERPERARERDPAALAWVLGLWDALWSELEDALSRIGTQLTRQIAAHPSTAGAGSFDHDLLARLQEMESQFAQAQSAMQRTRALLVRSSGTRLAPSRSRPFPFPAGRSWQRLAQLAARLSDPDAQLQGSLEALLDGHAELARLPFLYQRWCGLQILEALARLGWTTRRDPIPALFLGGHVGFEGPGDLQLWVEPRIPPAASEERPHESGLCAVGSQALRPDYLFVVRTAGGPEAYVLDPNFTTVAPEAEQKGKYRSRLAFAVPRVLAGVPTRTPPRRSWAAQPLRRHGNVLLDAEARLGIVPMHPLEKDWTGLEAWLRDLLPPISGS